MSTYATAQHKIVFIDRGREDDIKPGMVFRLYQHFDPSNDKKLTDTDVAIEADMMIIHATEKFSTAIVLTSLNTIVDKSNVVALTDVSDV